MELRGVLDKVGGITYLSELPDLSPTTANVSQYVEMIEEKSILRHLIKASNEIIELGYAGTEEVINVMDAAEQKIFNVLKNKNQRGYSSIKDILKDSIEIIEKLYKKEGFMTGVPTGFGDLDLRTAGFQPSDLIILAARSRNG